MDTCPLVRDARYVEADAGACYRRTVVAFRSGRASYVECQLAARRLVRATSELASVEAACRAGTHRHEFIDYAVRPGNLNPADRGRISNAGPEMV